MASENQETKTEASGDLDTPSSEPLNEPPVSDRPQSVTIGRPPSNITSRPGSVALSPSAWRVSCSITRGVSSPSTASSQDPVNRSPANSNASSNFAALQVVEERPNSPPSPAGSAKVEVNPRPATAPAVQTEAEDVARISAELNGAATILADGLGESIIPNEGTETVPVTKPGSEESVVPVETETIDADAVPISVTAVNPPAEETHRSSVSSTSSGTSFFVDSPATHGTLSSSSLQNLRLSTCDVPPLPPPPPPPPPPLIFADDPLLPPNEETEFARGESIARSPSVGVRHLTPAHLVKNKSGSNVGSGGSSSLQRGPSCEGVSKPSVASSRNSRLADLSEDTAPIEKEGWLFKEGRIRKSWRKRWFVLKGSSLAYFAGVGDAKPKGILNLETAKLSPVAPDKIKSPNGKPCLELLVEGRKLYFATVGAGDFHDWMVAINNKIACLDYVKKKRLLNQKVDQRVMLFFANPHSTSFCADNETVPLEALVALKFPFKYHYALRTLSLENASLGDLELQVLSEPLAENTTIEVLNLARNQIGPEGAAHFAQAFKYNKSIKELFLHDNVLGPQGVKCLADCLPSHRNLCTLTLGGNFIGDEGVDYLVSSMLKHNHVMPILSIPNNNITNAGAAGIAELCKKSSSLTSLQLENNSISNDGVSNICSALSNNESVTNLELAFNTFDSLGVLYLAQLLQMNLNVKTISLQGNSIGEDSLVALVAADENFEFSELEFTRNSGLDALEKDRTSSESLMVSAVAGHQ